MARLILDTGVLIAGVRGQLNLAALGDNDGLAIPAVATERIILTTDEQAHFAELPGVTARLVIV